jgi:hypothetical protein
VRRDGSFTLRDAQDERLLTMRGVLRGGAGSGTLRFIESQPDQRGVCDTGTVGFSASR